MGLDPIRYFLLKEGGIVDDGDFSDLEIVPKLNADLADNLGNLFARIISPTINPRGGNSSLRHPHTRRQQLYRQHQDITRYTPTFACFLFSRFFRFRGFFFVLMYVLRKGG